MVKRFVSLTAFVLATLLPSGCGSGTDSKGPGTTPGNTGKGSRADAAAGVRRINGGGATFINPMMSKWSGEYVKANGVEVNYQSIGSGAGITQMTAKILDFGCSDAFMNDENLSKAREKGGDVVHIPLIMGAVVMAYN